MNETPKEGDTIIHATICPIEDGTCPTILLGLHKKDNDPRHCGYDAHIIRATKAPEILNAETGNFNTQ